MASAIILLASQALALVPAFAAPAAEAPALRGVRISAAATVEILRAETNREARGPQELTRQRRTGADGRISIEFE